MVTPCRGAGYEGPHERVPKGAIMATTRDVLNKTTELWNAHDREGWTACAAEDIEVIVSGGVRLTGQQGAAQLFDTWTEAFPDTHVEHVLQVVEGDNAVQESHFRGTHTGTMRSPAGEIPATGREVDIPFTALMSVRDGKMTGFRVYFDQLDMLSQLGLTDSTAAQPAGVA